MRRLALLLALCAVPGCTCTPENTNDGGAGGGLFAGGGGGGSASGGGVATGGGSTTGGGTEGSTGGGEPFVDDGGIGLDARPANATCIAPAPPLTGSGVVLTKVYEGLNQPVGLFQAPNDATRVFVQERQGYIRTFPKTSSAVISPFLDIHTRVNTQGEGGFLGMAFHPQWPTKAEVFVSYTESSNPLRSVIARYRSTDNGVTLDASTEERLLVLEQPYDNHNGGHIEFGPDGYLYIGFGDGGSGGDPQNHAQRLNTILGKFIRIDVDVPAAQRYAIPSDNPYANGLVCNRDDAGTTDHPDASVQCAEIYALGVRNPWRWSFDQVSGQLWVGDVGQGDWEEVDVIQRGGNYGWKVREGLHCYGGGTCSTAGYIDPLIDYSHTEGNSITGGYVYRGSIASLQGKYIFGDYGSGSIWVLESDGAGGYTKRFLAHRNTIASFGVVDGELFAIDLVDGSAHRLDPDGAQPVDNFPKTLSATGCFDSSNVTGPSLIPYSINAPFWSDGAIKDRYFAIPDGETIGVNPDGGDFDFPNGTVLVKHFTLGGTRIETRLFMRHSDGNWAGYSYEWNDAGTDATLLAGSRSKQVNGQTWYYPSREQCLQCHSVQAGRSLGPELAQFNRPQTYPSTGRTADQLRTLETLGYFTDPLPAVEDRPKLPAPFGSDPLESRARSWLHSNCAPCHQQGYGQGPADWRYWLSFEDTASCNAAPQNGGLGIDGGALIKPGHPEQSIVSVRIHALDSRRMPPLGSLKVDDQGAALIDAWISSITTCP